jgi:hypothetical protein
VIVAVETLPLLPLQSFVSLPFSNLTPSSSPLSCKILAKSQRKELNTRSVCCSVRAGKKKI